MSKQTHLMTRNGYYYFRIAIPTLFMPRFGRKELTYSLRTKDYTVAKIRCWMMLQVAEWLFKKVKAMPRLTPEQALEITKAYFKECLDRLQLQLDEADQSSKKLMEVTNEGWSWPSSLAEGTINSPNFLFPTEEREKNCTPERSIPIPMPIGEETFDFKMPPLYDCSKSAIIRYLINENQMDVKEGTISYNTLKKYVDLAVYELKRLQQKHVNLEANVQVNENWWEDKIPMPLISSPSVKSSILVSEAFAKYLDECSVSDREKTINTKKTTLELWVGIVGDMPISNLDKEKARIFKETLIKLPANMKQRFKDQAIKDIDLGKIPKEQRLKVATVNARIVKMAAFMQWAIDQGYYQTNNPFRGLALKDTVRAENKKDHFSKQQLETIFSTPVYKGSQSDGQKERYKAGDKIIEDGLYWIPLIALYSGARLQEICQLYISDLIQVHGVMVFDINKKSDDKSLKTPASERLTPIHPKLMELGLLEYKDRQADKEEMRLFPDVPLSSDGTYSSGFSKRFNYFLKHFGIKTTKTSFHSFRHTFIDTMRSETDVPEEVREALVGHLGNRTVHSNYGGPMGVQRLYDGITQLKYPLTVFD